ncbi:hypothetical protein [Halalkalirubrum salinum]|uniref:hypothetical protein n=1 Tax=Halalkalirubrum salinum TaxID=2563889 RepID=UPI0010FB58A4|nr:hypothetical protein [Halalkalirubrum salinum]
MDLAEAKQDAIVAAAAGGSTIALVVVLRMGLGADLPALVELSPLFVYFAYLFGRNAIPGELFERATPWAAIAVAVAIAVIVWTAV